MEYIIKPGDTLFAIARRFGITLEQLLAANPGITNPAAIVPGQRITIPGTAPPVPAPQIYVVQSGNTLSGIARRFGLTTGQLLAANPQISDPNRITLGQRIIIPGAQPPSGTAFYTIRSGDTLFRIAQRFGTTVDTLLRLNPGIDPNRLFVGQQISVPAVGPTPPPVVPPGCIVYVSNRSGQPEAWRTSGAGVGTVQITRGSGTAAQPVSNPKWSPNGRRIAYQAVGGLFIIDPCGRRPVLLASGVYNYSWSHDSGRIVFTGPEGTFITDLQGNKRKLENSVGNPVWFPGDRRIAGSVGETEEIRFSHIATMDVSGANLKVIEPLLPGQTVKLSPNGRYAAAELFKGYGYGVFSTVTLYDFNTGQPVRLPGFEIPIRTDINFVHDVSHMGGWSPDSSRFVYSTILNEQGLGEVRVVNPQGTLLQKFTRSYYPIPAWSPVPDWIIYTVSEQPGTTAFDAVAPRNMYVRNLNTNREILIAGPGDDHSPDWNGVACTPC